MFALTASCDLTVCFLTVERNERAQKKKSILAPRCDRANTHPCRDWMSGQPDFGQPNFGQPDIGQHLRFSWTQRCR